MHKSKDKISEREINYKKTFLTDPGQRVIEDLKISLKHGENLYHTNQTNGDLHYMLGRQSVINDILFILNKKS